MTASSIPADAELWAVVVTYRRPDVLGQMLAAVSKQTRRPDHLIVVDNDADPAVRGAAERVGATYLDSGGNIGPAGGVALAMRYVIERACANDWLLCLDDDDPPWRDDLFAVIWAFAHEQLAVDSTTACVGALGGTYRRHLGLFRRLEDTELEGAVSVDVIGGNVFPLYRCQAIREIGVPDASLFWGFEEGEYGLRLRKAGRSLYVSGDLALDWRRVAGQLNRKSTTLRSAPDKAAWRRYYGVRNAVVIARRYGRFWTPPLVAAGGAFRGVVRLTRRRRPVREVLLPVRGAWDGLKGKLGRTVDPGSNRKAD